ncbi:hypothetical protein MEI_01499 [Bartonella vinsonii subsp. arupensis Pm136co]|uniref:Phage protein n=1 Tax=Bartonella vinsonii subsp. arupensis Pm136co TaxID=1094561 RepID=A0ABP2QVN6_BARVI|nr:hypothetical protein [Bartonella vinsonii]EJF96887.1 hypothetical protein MEI_01499 [Bartonella vinsonii subsp. arupensis Pm136co]
MNAQMSEEMEGINEEYTAEQQVFDDDGHFDGGSDSKTVTSDDVSSQEPVSQSVHEASDISTVEEQRAEEQVRQAREALMKFYDPQSQGSSVDGENTPPDMSQDIVGYMAWMGKKLQEQDAFIKSQQEVQRQTFEQQQYDAHLNHFLENSVTAVKKKYSDFDAAADYLYETRAKQLAAWSTVYPEYAQKSTIDAIIGNELRTIVATCAQKGVNPADELYGIAKNLGYQNKAVQANNKVAALQSRQNSAKTLTASGGGGSVGPMTKQTLSDMSEKEFDAWISNPKNEARFYEIMGADPD